MNNLKEKKKEVVKKNFINNLDFSRKKINSLKKYFISIKKDWEEYMTNNQISVDDIEVIVYIIFFSNIERSIKKIKFKNGKNLNEIEREAFKEVIFKIISRIEIEHKKSVFPKVSYFFNIKGMKERFNKITKLNNWYNIIFQEAKRIKLEDQIQDFLEKIIKLDSNRKKIKIIKYNRNQYEKKKLSETFQLFYKGVSIYSNQINSINFNALIFLILYEITSNSSFNILKKLYNLNSTEIYYKKKEEKREIESEILMIIKKEFIQEIHSLSLTHKIIEMVYLI